jgi:hypothetical protein
VKLNIFRGTPGKPTGRRQEVPQDPDTKLQEIYDRVLRMTGRPDPSKAREAQEIITALARKAFGTETPDAWRRSSPEVHRRVAEEIAAGRRVVVTGGQLRFEDGGYA